MNGFSGSVSAILTAVPGEREIQMEEFTMKKNNVKYTLAAAAAVLAIIAVQMILTCVFTCRAEEIFSRTAMSALFFYSVMRLGRETRRARKAAD